MLEINGKYTTAKIMVDSLEDGCCKQIVEFVNHPAFTNQVAIMPDTHQGRGSVIGFTMPLTSKVIPAVIGVDIGCGMLSVNIGKELPLSYELIDHRIRKAIPFGMELHDRGVIHLKNDFPWKQTAVKANHFVMTYQEKYGVRYLPPTYDMDWFTDLCDRVGSHLGKAIASIGTLGGGNHFIEIGQSTLTGDYWVTVHSGSRNLGKRVCDYWQHKATKILRKEKQALLDEKISWIRENYSGMEVKAKIREARELLGLDSIVNNDLHFLEGESAFGYFFDMIFCQIFAEVNRNAMMRIILDIMGLPEKERIHTIHNYIDFHDLVIRKGAIRSYENEKVIIPFNMRDGLLICEGKSNPEWNFSAPHGAGRLYSRSQAKKLISLESFQQSMEGVYSSSVNRSTIDESPMAYKEAKFIEEAITPTAHICDRIRPIINLKDCEGSLVEE